MIDKSPDYYFVVYLLYFIVSGIFSFLINNLFLKFVKTLGIRNQDDTVIRWGSQSKPAVGGFSFTLFFFCRLSFIRFSLIAARFF
ncbi:MAG: hypothetical protein IPH33_17450 [Bacteroidetes bacterium]|nr:hypothetical protein [Bacteroidota bacterium]